MTDLAELAAATLVGLPSMTPARLRHLIDRLVPCEVEEGVLAVHPHLQHWLCVVNCYFTGVAGTKTAGPNWKDLHQALQQLPLALLQQLQTLNP